MPICHDCGEEIILVRRNGKLVPCDPWPANHYTNRKHIEAVRGKKPKAKKPKAPKEPELSGEDEMMLEVLTAQFDKKRAPGLLPHAKGDTFEARFRAALAYADSEGGS